MLEAWAVGERPPLSSVPTSWVDPFGRELIDCSLQSWAEELLVCLLGKVSPVLGLSWRSVPAESVLEDWTAPCIGFCKPLESSVYLAQPA